MKVVEILIIGKWYPMQTALYVELESSFLSGKSSLNILRENKAGFRRECQLLFELHKPRIKPFGAFQILHHQVGNGVKENEKKKSY